MKKELIFFIPLVLWLTTSCTTRENKQATQFIQELGIRLPANNACYVIYIPGNGCSSCIQGAINDIRESQDTLFVFACNSEKDFYLQSKKKPLLFPNLILDKKHAAARAKITSTYPIVFLFVNGKYVSQWPYSHKQNNSLLQNTSIKLNKNELNLGLCKQGMLYKDTIRITNTGDRTLIINKIYSSCDCTKVEWENKQIKTMQHFDLYITFTAEEQGTFERYITIDCNTKDSPIEILIRGHVEEEYSTSS